jgi:hypothetical protein
LGPKAGERASDVATDRQYFTIDEEERVEVFPIGALR